MQKRTKFATKHIEKIGPLKQLMKNGRNFKNKTNPIKIESFSMDSMLNSLKKIINGLMGFLK